MKIKLTNILLIIFALAFVGFAQTHTGGSIKGKLLKSTGKPLPYTEIELVPVGAKKIVIDSRLLATSGSTGDFAFANIPDGHYTLSINFDDKPSNLSPYETFFYPDASRRVQAEVFEIDGSKKLSGIIFRLPAPLAQKKITGKVVSADGKPVPNAWLAMRDLDYDLFISFGEVKTDKNGNFAAPGFVGRRYQIGALLFGKEDKYGFDSAPIAAGESQTFTLDAATPFIQIMLKASPDTKRIKDKYVALETPKNGGDLQNINIALR